MDDSHPLLPGPRPPSDFIPSSYPPAPRRWSVHAPTSQTREKYISPDPSPVTEDFAKERQPRRTSTDYGFPPTDYYGHGHENGAIVRAAFRTSAEVDPFYYPIMPQRPPQAPVKQRKLSRKVDGKQPTFLTKLYQILEQTEYHHIIRWDEAGEVIVIEKPDELADKILPLVYRQSRFASFSRQLNIYGFMRKVSLRHVDRGICDPDASTWSHPFLRRSSTSAEVQGFKRRVPPRPSQSSKRRASMISSYHDDQAMGLSPTSSEGSYHSPPDAYHHHLLADLDEDKATIFNPPTVLPPFEAGSPDGLPDFNGRSNSFDGGVAARPIPPPAIPGFAAGFSTSVPSLFLDRNGGGVPSSAPANVTNFPAGEGLRIAQGHLRTRSVQGEPPSATLFSPNTLDQPWATEDFAQAVRDAEPAPTYDPEQPSTWARRGFTDIHTGASVAPPTDRLGFIPSSVPSDFAPGGFAVQHHPSHHRHASHGHQLPQVRVEPAVAAPETVSPGIYQFGFGLQAHKSSAPSSTPRAVPMRQERRGSVTSSPYSPRLRPLGSLSLGNVRVISGSASKDNESSSRSSILDRDGPSEEEALPSAGLRGLHRGPFEGILPDDAHFVLRD